MIPETIMVQIDPGEHAFRACAIRLCPGDPWHVMIAVGDIDRNLSPVETMFAPSVFGMAGDEDLTAKLVFLLGRSWAEVLDDPTGVIGFQTRVLDELSEDMIESLRAMSLDYVREWALAGGEPLTEGELLRAKVTGDNPLVLRG